MRKILWLHPEPEPSEGGVISFRRQLLLVLAAVTFWGSWLLFLWVPAPRGPYASESAMVFWGVCLALITYALRKHWPRLDGKLFTLGSALWILSIYLVFRRPAILALFTIPIMAAGLLWNSKAIWAVTLTGIMAVLALRTGHPGNVTLLWITLYIATGTIGLCTLQALELVDHWEREATLKQRSLIQQLRQRQGELNRALKALDIAYASLKRSNNELLIARQEAEEARALKEQFVANVSHELRTPLNLILGFVEMMYLSPESYPGENWTPTLRGDIEELYRASRHLESLVNDVLDLSRIDARHLPMVRELQDLREIIRDAPETIAPLLHQRGLAFSFTCPDELPQLFVDRTRIRQVMLNLLNNAARYTDHGGISVRISKTQDSLIVSVQDTGIGIPKDQQEKIFEVFHQADGGLRGRGGAGLGLALSRQFIEMHGGRMWVESE
ncbi:MAG: hypothetical protein J7M05_06965, partial [Anaerolineae bacterium]|nr:hypothetical protein [Anaerolineae bacterium]